MKLKKEVIIGVVAVVVLFIFIWGITVLKNEQFFSKHTYFFSKYDKVTGLLVGNPVILKGLRVGKVMEMDLCDDNSGKVYVKIMLSKDILIPSNSIMKIGSSDLLGSKIIEIILGDSKTYAKSGDYLLSEIQKSLQEEVSFQVLPLKVKAEQLISSIDTLLQSVEMILNKKTRENLKKSFESISVAIQNLEQTTFHLDTLVGTERHRLKRIFENVESITGNIKSNNKQIDNVIHNFSNLTDTLVKLNFVGVINKADKAMTGVSSIVDKINRGEGSIGQLIKNDTLYNNLESSSKNLDKLLEDLRLNPGRYVHISVFGGKDKKKKSEVANDKLNQKKNK